MRDRESPVLLFYRTPNWIMTIYGKMRKGIRKGLEWEGGERKVEIEERTPIVLAELALGSVGHTGR